MDRRVTIKWLLTAAAAIPLGGIASLQAREDATGAPAEAQPYGTDPKLKPIYHPGELWPLTFTPAQKALATTLCDTIIPADATSPSASQVGVVEFIDEWISAPYFPRDREVVLEGLAWLDAEAGRRFSKPAIELAPGQLAAICDDVCYLPNVQPDLLEAAKFFARYRDLTTGGFYTTAQGRDDLRYVGNVALPRFDGPPAAVLRKVGLI